jgi:membrane-associated phospholipid phosphatase
VALTTAADHSVLWIALAAVLALAGGRRGRRAAAHGLTALALASATSNGPLKFAFRSQRPTRRPPLIRVPGTYSFPSGHSASAFAFATAAAAELPAAAPVLLPFAAAVAYSRVRVGVHRWRDVLAGGAIGVACGAVTDTAARRSPRWSSRTFSEEPPSVRNNDFRPFPRASCPGPILVTAFP